MSRPAPRTLGTLAGVLIGVLVAVLAVGWWWPSPEAKTRSAQAPVPTAPVESSSAPTPAPRPRCPATVDQPFVPTSITVAGVPGRSKVVALPRDANGVPGIPPLSGEGKNVFAFDREQGIEPGEDRGNVLLNAHTWPDGTALGNDLLRRLDRGDRIVVAGRATKLCYRVTEKVEVSAAQGLPRYYATTGRPQLAIVVCSGRRLGPGNWENRTIWFASPSV